MKPDRFDHRFVQTGSFDASLGICRDALGWKVLLAWGGEGERVVPIGMALRR